MVRILVSLGPLSPAALGQTIRGADSGAGAFGATLHTHTHTHTHNEHSRTHTHTHREGHTHTHTITAHAHTRAHTHTHTRTPPPPPPTTTTTTTTTISSPTHPQLCTNTCIFPLRSFRVEVESSLWRLAPTVSPTLDPSPPSPALEPFISALVQNQLSLSIFGASLGTSLYQGLKSVSRTAVSKADNAPKGLI